MLRDIALNPQAFAYNRTNTEYATVYSVPVSPTFGFTIITGGSNPSDNNTITFSITTNGTTVTKTYTFKNIPSGNYEVEIGATLTATLINLKNKINSNSGSDNVGAYIDINGNLIIIHNNHGYNNNVSISSTNPSNLFNYDNSSSNGSNGFEVYNNKDFTIVVDYNNTIYNINIALSGLTKATTASDIATIINNALSSNTPPIPANATAYSTAVLNRSRIKITATNTNVKSIRIVNNNIPQLFINGDISTTKADVGSNKFDIHNSLGFVELHYTSEKFNYRTVNRSLLQLHKYTSDVYNEFILFRDFYDIYTGDEPNNIDSNRFTFKAPVYIFERDLQINGSLILKRPFQSLTVNTININDPFVITNAGGATLYKGGLGIFKSTNNYAYVAYNAGNGFYFLDNTQLQNDTSSIDLSKLTKIYAQDIILQNVIVIGNSQLPGKYNADSLGNINTALQSAINELTNGGIIFIRRGTYSLPTNISVNKPNIQIIGESAIINMYNNITLSNDYTIIKGIRFIVASNQTAISASSGSHIVTECYFEPLSGATNTTDITVASGATVIASACISKVHNRYI